MVLLFLLGMADPKTFVSRLKREAGRLHFCIKNLRKSHCPLISLTCLEGIAESRGGVGQGSRNRGPQGPRWPAVEWKQCPSPVWSPDSALQEGVLTISLSTAAVSVLLSGVPCPIVIAWAIGKLYYENEQ